MLETTAECFFEGGVLKAKSKNLPTLAFARPAELAEARFESDPPLESLALNAGQDVLAAAFKTLPFVRGPLPTPTYGPAITPPARAAFELLAGLGESALFASSPTGRLKVLRGEVDDFLLFARRRNDVWSVGALTVSETTLTVRFEDLWKSLPERARAKKYLVEVFKDPGERLVLEDVAPDARITLDLQPGGGFLLAFWPVW